MQMVNLTDSQYLSINLYQHLYQSQKILHPKMKQINQNYLFQGVSTNAKKSFG